MKRTDAAHHAGNLFQTGNPLTGRRGTRLDHTWLNAVQEELAGTIEAAGIVLDPADDRQLLQAIRTLAVPSFATLAEAMGETGTATLPGTVRLVQVRGHTTEGTGGAPWMRAEAEPSHPGRFRDAAGQWWELHHRRPSPLMLGARGDGVADDRAGLQAAVDYAVATGAPAIDGEGRTYRLVATPEVRGPETNSPVTAYDLHFAVRLPDAPGADLQLDRMHLVLEAAKTGNDISAAIGNTHADRFGRLALGREVTVDLDGRANPNGGGPGRTVQQRGLVLYGLHLHTLARFVNAGPQASGYGLHLYHGTLTGELNAERLSGGFWAAWSRVRLDGGRVAHLNEALDLDKGDFDCAVANLSAYRCREVIDANGCQGLSVTGCDFVESGVHVFWNGKEHYVRFEDHIAAKTGGVPRAAPVFVGGRGLRMQGCRHVGRYAEKPGAFLVIGNKRVDRKGLANRNYAGGACTGDVTISGFTVEDCGYLAVNECDGLRLANGTMRNLRAPAADGLSEKSRYALRILTQAGHRDPRNATPAQRAALDAARAGSRLAVAFSGIRIEGTDGGGVLVQGADRLDIDGLDIAGYGRRYALAVRDIGLRGTAGRIEGLRTAPAAPGTHDFGVYLQGAGPVGAIRWGSGNRIEDLAGVRGIALGGNAADGLSGRTVTVPLGSLAPGESAAELLLVAGRTAHLLRAAIASTAPVAASGRVDLVLSRSHPRHGTAAVARVSTGDGSLDLTRPLVGRVFFDGANDPAAAVEAPGTFHARIEAAGGARFAGGVLSLEILDY